MTYLSLGIVGYGRVAAIHAGALAALDGVHVAAVLGPDVDKASRLATATGMATDDIDVFAAHVDAVVVASPSHLHPAHARALLRRGLPTLVELPAAHTLGEAEAIRDAAARAGTAVFGAHTSRWLPAVGAIAAALADGRLGDVTTVAIDRRIATRDRRWLDDPLVHHGQHAIDELRMWFGDVSPICAARSRDAGTESVSFEVELPTGARAAVSIEHGSSQDALAVRVSGSGGTLTSDGFGCLAGDAGVVPGSWRDEAADDAYRRAIAEQDAVFVAAVRGTGRYPSFDETLANTALVERLAALAATA